MHAIDDIDRFAALDASNTANAWRRRLQGRSSIRSGPLCGIEEFELFGRVHHCSLRSGSTLFSTSESDIDCDVVLDHRPSCTR